MHRASIGPLSLSVQPSSCSSTFGRCKIASPGNAMYDIGGRDAVTAAGIVGDESSVCGAAERHTPSGEQTEFNST